MNIICKYKSSKKPPVNILFFHTQKQKNLKNARALRSDEKNLRSIT